MQKRNKTRRAQPVTGAMRVPFKPGLVPALLAWFRRHAMDLPWRRTRDPYAIWISEIMLQQTQVKTVIPYWTRWMRALPTLPSLARARPEKVLKLWEGLGYYTRARNLQSAARRIVKQHDGVFPSAFDDLLALPGVGRYTAGAICSIAFNQPTPILDGNLIRVLTRLFGVRENPKTRQTNDLLWTLAEKLVRQAAHLEVNPQPATGNPQPLRNCSQLNQALMEFGREICSPRRPKCESCPLRRKCAAFAQGCVDALPNTGPRPVATHRRVVAFVIERRRRFLVRQRPAGKVNAGLWEFPNVEVEVNGDVARKPAANGFRAAQFKQLARANFGCRLHSLKPLCQFQHSITRYRISLAAIRASARGPIDKGEGAVRWATERELGKLPFTGAHRKICAALLNP